MTKGKTEIENDIQFIKSILPSSYVVQESKKAGSIHCKSETGIQDEKLWKALFRVIKKHFTGRFQEVFHNTCTYHVDFTIYLKVE